MKAAFQAQERRAGTVWRVSVQDRLGDICTGLGANRRQARRNLRLLLHEIAPGVRVRYRNENANLTKPTP